MSTSPAAHRLSRDDARRIAVRAQLLDADRPGDVVDVAEQLGSIKIDPTATIAPCEHTVLWSRIGWAYEPGRLKDAVERDRLLFEHEGRFHAAGLLPLMLPQMRAWQPYRAANRDWLAANDVFRRELLARLRAEGPLPASGIPDTAVEARPSDGWYGPNQVPHMLEFLAAKGEVAIAGRDGRHRLWDLAERVYPSDLPDYDTPTATGLLQERRLRAAGIAKRNSPWTRVGEAGEPAEVEGSRWRWRVDPEALAALDDEDPGGRVAFLNPYDGMLADRPRIEELFGFKYVLEQFKPKPQRRYGYFAHPILIGDRFAGLLDAEVDRDRRVLRVNAVHELMPFDDEEHEMVRAELRELADWLGVEYTPPA